MSWQGLVGISVFLYSVSVLLQRILLKNKKSEAVSFSIFFQIGVAITTGVLVLIIGGKLTLPDFSNVSLSLLIMTLFYALANIFIFKSLKEIEASRFTVIFSGKTVIAVLGASFFFNENLNISQWIGALLVITGVIIVSVENFKLKLAKGDMFAIAAAVLFGLANINDRFLVKFFDPYSYVVIGFLLPGILIAVINPGKIKLIKNYCNKSIIYKMIFLFAIYGLSAVAFFSALQIAPNSSQVFAINTFTGVLTVIFAILFLKERNNLPGKILGAVLSLIGLLLVNQ